MGRHPEHGLTNHKLFTVWWNMKQRCYDPKQTNYKNYGGRGVKVCDEWISDFKAFYDWAINNGWKYGLHIDKDIIGDGKLYSPDTCCFVTRKENNNRKRSNVIYNGKRQSLSELSKEYKIHYPLLILRIKLGWSLEESLLTPVRLYKKRSISITL